MSSIQKITEASGDERFSSALRPAAFVLLVSLLMAGWLQYRPLRSDALILGVFSPFGGREAMMRAAIASGANIVAPSPLPFALIVQSDDPEFFARLHHAGAWLLLDATGRGLCSGVELITRQS